MIKAILTFGLSCQTMKMKEKSYQYKLIHFKLSEEVHRTFLEIQKRNWCKIVALLFGVSLLIES